MERSVGRAARTLGVMLCAWAIGGSARADSTPDWERWPIDVTVDIEVRDGPAEYVYVLSPIGCDAEAGDDYVVITDRGLVERRVADDADSDAEQECAAQTLYLLPRERYPAVDGKIPALDALTPAERKAVLGGEDVPELALAEASWWTGELYQVRDVYAYYRVETDATDEDAPVLTSLRREVAYHRHPTKMFCPGELGSLTYADDDRPSVPYPDGDLFDPRPLCPVCAVCPVVAPTSAASPVASGAVTTEPPASAPTPVASPPTVTTPDVTTPSMTVPTRAIDPTLERVVLAVVCLLVGGLAGLRLRRRP